jgi:sugar/nucleoside kinase (ribokinase family)
MTAPLFDILVAGEINPDLILSGDVDPAFGQVERLVDSAELMIGSSAAIVACGAARLGLKVAFIGVCGDDPFGDFMRDEIDSRGIDISNIIVIPGGQTGLSVLLNRGADRAILTHPGLISALRAEDISDELLVRSRHLHVAGYFLQTALQPGLPGLFAHAQSLGLTTSLDTNWDPQESWIGIDELLESVDVFMSNEKEALAISKVEKIEPAIQHLRGFCKEVAIKQGKDGALACHGTEIVKLPSIPVDVVDTVGAGDSFDAGFLYGFLNNWSLEKTLQLAVVCGSLSTRCAGGTAGQPNLEEAMRYVPPGGPRRSGTEV